MAGFAIIDPVDEAKFPPRLVLQEERVQILTTLLNRIDSLLDPDPHDPWPRHTQHSGASIAVTVGAYRRAGGLPAVPVGEDRAFFDALRYHDAAIRHVSDAMVVVSGRLLGRADGGMADTMRRRIMTPDLWLDDPIETVETCIRRAKARSLARLLWQANGHEPDIMWLADLIAVPAGMIVEALGSATFGACWQALEIGSMLLKRQPVPVCDCEAEISAAELVVERLERSDVVAELIFGL